MSVRGKIVWHDLMTTDVEAAKGFYGELFGWTIKKDEHGPYNLILNEGRDLGGILALGPEQKGVPAHWVAYVAVDDVAAAAKRVTERGGRVHVPPTVIEKVGTFTVVADPHGAVFAAFQYPAGHPSKPESDAPPAPGTFCWDELYSPDLAASEAFYGHVTGWKADKTDMGPPLGTYTVWKRGEAGDVNAAGMMKQMPPVPQPAWLSYIAVASCDETVARIGRLGGQVVMPPMDIPNVGRFTVAMDPQHAAFGVLQGG